jgi:hypothetical protein
MKPDEAKIAQLKAIPGLAGHVLVGPNGEILSHDAPNAEDLGALVAICRGNCSTVEKELASPPVHLMAFHRGHSERFFVLPLEKNSLGFFQKKEAVGAHLLAGVTEWKDSIET